MSDGICLGLSLETWGYILIGINLAKCLFITVCLVILLVTGNGRALFQECPDCRVPESKKEVNATLGCLIGFGLIEALVLLLVIIGIKKILPGMLIPWLVVALIGAISESVTFLRFLISKEKILPIVAFMHAISVTVTVFSAVIMVLLYKWLRTKT